MIKKLSELVYEVGFEAPMKRGWRDWGSVNNDPMLAKVVSIRSHGRVEVVWNHGPSAIVQPYDILVWVSDAPVLVPSKALIALKDEVLRLQRLYIDAHNALLVGDAPCEYEEHDGMTWKELAELRLQKLRDLGHDPMCSMPLSQELSEANATIAMLAQQLADKKEIIRRLTT